jgi:hypothetical protein
MPGQLGGTPQQVPTSLAFEQVLTVVEVRLHVDGPGHGWVELHASPWHSFALARELRAERRSHELR